METVAAREEWGGETLFLSKRVGEGRERCRGRNRFFFLFSRERFLVYSVFFRLFFSSRRLILCVIWGFVLKFSGIIHKTRLVLLQQFEYYDVSVSYVRIYTYTGAGGVHILLCKHNVIIFLNSFPLLYIYINYNFLR